MVFIATNGMILQVELAGWTLEEYEAGKRRKKDEVPSGWWFGWGGKNKGVIYSNASSNPLINADEVKLMAERESIEASNKASNNLT